MAAAQVFALQRKLRDAERVLSVVAEQWQRMAMSGAPVGTQDYMDGPVVGAEKYGNQRVSFTFIPEGCDDGPDVRDLDALEPDDGR